MIFFQMLGAGQVGLGHARVKVLRVNDLLQALGAGQVGLGHVLVKVLRVDDLLPVLGARQVSLAHALVKVPPSLSSTCLDPLRHKSFDFEG